MNICMCGIQAGYPHDPLCPYPYYGRNTEQESKWMDAYRAKKQDIEATQPIAAVNPQSEIDNRKSQ